MADKLMYISNGDYPFSRLTLGVEMFEHSTQWSNQSKFIKDPNVVEQTNKIMLL